METRVEGAQVGETHVGGTDKGDKGRGTRVGVGGGWAFCKRCK